MSPARPRHGRPPWLAGLLCVLLFLAARLLLRLNSPFTDVVEFNAAVWSQAAHNFLRAGFGACVPAAFYFGPLPIPADAYYVHHPPLLALVLAGGFRLFGEHEWVARLIPDISSLLAVVLLWVILNDCRGPRAATFAAALLAAMPMELHYGQMVNFEAVTLATLLAGLLGQRHWERAGGGGWFALMIAGYLIAVSTAWLGYFFVLAFAIHLILRDRARAGWLLIGLALLSGALFLLQIRLASPTAWDSLAFAFRIRAGHSTISGQKIPFGPWSARVFYTLFITHILWPAWLLACAGALLLIRERRDPSAAWLGRVSFIFFAMDALYVCAFRNASYIHNYACFYFILPVAICGGVALDAGAGWLDSRRANAGSAAGLAACALLCAGGWRAADRLLGQARLLGRTEGAPGDLIPRLGRLIEMEFPPDAIVMTNVDPGYTPQLAYYAGHSIINNLTDEASWRDALNDPGNSIGGLIWMDGDGAGEILPLLPMDSRRTVRIGDLPFCIWKPSPRQPLTPPAAAPPTAAPPASPSAAPGAPASGPPAAPSGPKSAPP